MNGKQLLGMIATALLVTVPLAAQQAEQPTEKDRAQAEKQMQKAEEMMRKAEQQMREAERVMRDAAERLGHLDEDRVRRQVERKVVIFGDRARLGLVLQSDANPKADAIGASVDAITPGSPAEDAGLQPGDIIVKFNGEALGAAKPQGDEDESAPTARLMELASHLKDGDKVTLEYRRGDQTRTVTLTATRGLGRGFTMVSVPEAPLVHVPEIDLDEMPDLDVNVFAVGRPWRDLELVTLNSELGEYFGTTEGLLVVNAPKDGALKLRAGDVILKIGDRTPTSPEQAIRILRSYEPGERVALQVMRKREKVALSVQMPEKKTGQFHWQQREFGKPLPPEVPAPPAPPAPTK